MNEQTPLNVFATAGLSTMADVLDRVEAEKTGNRRRDAVSAFSTARKVLRIDWKDVKATPPALRDLLGRNCAAELGLSDRRWANVCSLIRKAFEEFGGFQRIVTRRIPLSEAWVEVLALIPDDMKHWRQALSRIACFCSALQLSPDAVDRQVLLEFFGALREEELLKDPRAKLKHTIACWNMCQRNVPGWPDIRLSSPFESTRYSLSAADFPGTFQADIEAWQQRCLNPDLFDVNAAPRALKSVTVEGQINRILRFASALVIEQLTTTEEITGFGSLFDDMERYKAGLRFFLERNDGEVTPGTAQIAATLCAVARHHVKVPLDVQKELDRLSAALRVPRSQTLTPTNRERLKQFDDPSNIQKIVHYPRQEAIRAQAILHPHRRAKAMERAVTAAILLTTCMRGKNIRTLEIRDFQWVDGHCYLSIPGDRVKNEADLGFEIAQERAELVKRHVRDFRPAFPGSDGPYLFPATDGGPKAHNTLFSNLISNIRKRTGLTMNPHLFRHMMAKIVVESDPGMALAMSRHLGHKQINTTMQHYLGTEGRAVSRRIDDIINEQTTPKAKRRKA